MSKFEILKNTFGHDKFRASQEEAIDAILSKKDLITILPTGGGKSLCYQLPSLMMEGVTIVISPLIALMQDQVNALVNSSINAHMINSSQNYEEIQETTKKLLAGEIKLLYIAPERFSANGFVELLKRVNINFFVIDEAHCVSEWGHEFRADYRNLSLLKQTFPLISIAAFTATATHKVQDDIVKTLNLENPLQIRGKTLRDNLKINAQQRIGNGRNQLVDFISKYNAQCGIVYAFSRKDVESVAGFLKTKGFSVGAYHAGLPSKIRDKVYKDFIYEKIDIVVATIAFGMGIDKSNIRFVVHMSMPKTMENYYQEIGRAGRDGVKAQTLLLYTKSDDVKMRSFIDDIDNNEYKELLYNKLRKMYSYSNSSECRHKLIAQYFDDDSESCEDICDNCKRGEVEKIDITLLAQKLLSGIYRCDQRFGLIHIVDILRGSKGQKIFQFNHDKLSVYGIGSDTNKNDWNAVADRLFELDAMEIGEFRAVKLKNFGIKILQKKVLIEIDKHKMNIKTTSKKKEISTPLNNDIFESFRALRLEIATKNEIPAYIVFSDKTLIDFSQKLPQNKEEMLEVNGVGEVKYERYGEEFLALCKEII
ncbi:DNA helicase RecQ [Sulfurimonas sp.]|uniref:DNA helicase RecQ n=1 Tax=Sulfurimonas sp. TaxID=2022749 RepID=UPI002B4698B1|nr:DNA helicase RecQ [Sulfurimonas sp.]